jgi:hypothetical protein
MTTKAVPCSCTTTSFSRLITYLSGHAAKMGRTGESMADYKNPDFKDPDLKVPDCKISEQQTPATTSQANQNLASEAVKNAGIIYFPVGTKKFIVMCLCIPFHGYEIWWLYKNFVRQKERGGKIRSPLWRINLPFLYLRNLLEAMRDEGKPFDLNSELPIEKIILYWVMLIFCWLCFPPPWSILGIFSFVPFIFVNKYLIKLNQLANPDLKVDDKLRPFDFLVILVGGAYFAVDLYVKYMMHF